jgi:hypothetical protein
MGVGPMETLIRTVFHGAHASFENDASNATPS